MEAADPLMLLLDPVASADGLLTWAEVVPADAGAAAEAAPAAMLPAACWLVHVSEILLTELAWKEPSLACVPWSSTWVPSFGFNIELSPVTLMVWPLSAFRVQLPPDCFRQPLMLDDVLLVLVVVLVVVWLL